MSNARRIGRFFIVCVMIQAMSLMQTQAEAFWFWETNEVSKEKRVSPDVERLKPSLLLDAKLKPGEFTEPLTLEQAYRFALGRSEDVSIKAEAIEETQAHFYQALAYIAPQVSFVMTRKDQDVASDSSTTLRRSTPEKGFTFTQPLFTGFKAMAAIRGAGAERKGREYDYERAKQLLLVDVADAFYANLGARRQAEILNTILKVLQDRTTELNERIRLGRSRQSEFQSNLTDLKQAEADLIEMKRVEVVSRQILEFYIGKEIKGALIEDAHSDQEASLDYFLNKADQRMDVRAARENTILAEQGVTVAQSGLFPSIHLDGNYYTQRVGTYSGVNWDVLLTCDVPIFDGMQTFGNIKQAVTGRDTQYLLYSRTRRQAYLDIQNAYEVYQASLRADRAFFEASEAAKENYRLNNEDFKLNLISNLDILDILRRYQVSARQSNVAHFSAKINYWKLRVAAGETL